MLVLSRKESESVIINENIVITILRIAGGGVRGRNRGASRDSRSP
jgi:carbon storage regulator CsrA